MAVSSDQSEILKIQIVGGPRQHLKRFWRRRYSTAEQKQPNSPDSKKPANLAVRLVCSLLGAADVVLDYIFVPFSVLLTTPFPASCFVPYAIF